MTFEADTIAAISTGTMGNGGIGIVRISGSDAFAIAGRLFRCANGKAANVPAYKSHTIHYGQIVWEGRLVDEVLLSVMRAPNTYTREDVVEINCHGGMLVTRRVLEAVLDAGARLAQPGEFTKRAFLNGRIDLTQAEAVIDIINSKNSYALAASEQQLSGKLSGRIADMRQNLLSHMAYIEAALDDPEHYDLTGYGEKMLPDVEKLEEEVLYLLKTSDDGRILQEGINTVILGKTNAGKSSLLNAMAGSDRAIVTEVEGTTRDVLEETINLQGMTLNLIDTAGIRDTDDIVEKIGIDRAIAVANQADLILYVVDVTKKMDDNDRKIIDIIKNHKSIILLNKCDRTDETLTDVSQVRECLGDGEINIMRMSARTGEGIGELAHTIMGLFFSGELGYNDQVYVTNARQKNLLNETKKSLTLVRDGIHAGMPEDCIAIDLMNAYESLGKIVGETVGEDLVNQVFERFCMGK